MPAEKRSDSSKQSDNGQRERARATDRSGQCGFAENLPGCDETVPEREYDDYVLAQRDSGSEEPDVLLDVPVVKVEEINLNVEERFRFGPRYWTL